MDWLDLLAVQGTLKSLLQHHSSKASILQCSAFFTVQLSYPYMTIEKTIALTRWTFVGKVMSLLFNMLSRLVIDCIKTKLIGWVRITLYKGDNRAWLWQILRMGHIFWIFQPDLQTQCFHICICLCPCNLLLWTLFCGCDIKSPPANPRLEIVYLFFYSV